MIPQGVDAAVDRSAVADAARDMAPADRGPDRPPSGIATRPANPTCKPFANPDQPPAKLSDTGCFDRADPKKPGPMLIPYDVASPLWSDGADKERYVALPDSAKLHVADDGHFDAPIGAVFVKSFKLGTRFVETRLLVRADEYRWVGYSYEWNDAQTEATVFPDALAGVTKPVRAGAGTQNWYFPSRADCFECHTKASGVSLGPTTQQLNRDWMFPSGTRANQIDTWEAIGLFDAPVRRMPGLPRPQSTEGTATDRARAYLQANCAMCHRPDGAFSSMDLRFATLLKDMNICNAAPERGDLGVAGALRLVPADPAKSLMSLRMRRTDKNRMPQLATSIVDMTGVNAVEAWIRSIARCP